jgi:hypothetical protein
MTEQSVGLGAEKRDDIGHGVILLVVPPGSAAWAGRCGNSHSLRGGTVQISTFLPVLLQS